MISFKINSGLGKSNLGIPILCAFVFFSILWLMDFPKPHVDDLFFCGASLNLAQGGEFTNPFIAWLPGHLFFFQPPVFSYAFLVWLKAFGISAASVTGFQGLVYILNSVAIITILHRYGSPVWLKCLVPLLVTATFMDTGLRMEPLAVVFALTGFAIIECDVRRTLWVFLCFLLMFLSMATAPRVALFATALAGLACHRLCPEGLAGKQVRRLIIPVSGAGLLAVLAFLWMIHFQAVEFCHVFFLHAKSVSARRPLDSYFLSQLGSVQIILMVISGLLLAFLFKHRKEKSVQFGLAIAMVFPVQFYLKFLGNGVGRFFLFLALMALVPLILKRCSAGGQKSMGLSLICLLIYMNGGLLANIEGTLAGKINSENQGEYLQAKLLVSTTSTPLFLDTSVARYVYDYKIPRGGVDLFFSPPFPRYIIDDTNYPQGIYVLSPRWSGYFIQTNDPSNFQWGVLKWMFYKNPRHIFIIHHQAEDYKTPK